MKIAELSKLEPGTSNLTVEGKLGRIYPVADRSGEKGAYTAQNCLLQDGTGDILVKFFVKGKTTDIIDPKNKDKVVKISHCKLGVYNGKPHIEATNKTEIIPVEPEKTVPIKESLMSKGGVNPPPLAGSRPEPPRPESPTVNTVNVVNFDKNRDKEYTIEKDISDKRTMFVSYWKDLCVAGKADCNMKSVAVFVQEATNIVFGTLKNYVSAIKEPEVKEVKEVKDETETKPEKKNPFLTKAEKSFEMSKTMGELSGMLQVLSMDVEFEKNSEAVKKLYNNRFSVLLQEK